LLCLTELRPGHGVLNTIMNLQISHSLPDTELLIRTWTTEFFPYGFTAKLWALAASMKRFGSISVTRSRTVGKTPWSGDQLVARTLLTAPGECDDVEVGGMNGF
jgi:hypothetical protein